MRARRSLPLLLLLISLGPVQSAHAQDLDADGIADATDNCPSVWNLGQDERDGDGVGDACDNCPFSANPTQSDGGGVGSNVADL